MSDLRAASSTFSTVARGVLTDAAAALPTLEELFPGSTEAALDQFSEKLEALVSDIENTILGWNEAVEQAAPPPPATE